MRKLEPVKKPAIVSVENRQKEAIIPTGMRMILRRVCSVVLDTENFSGTAEVSISFVSQEEIQALNAQFRGKDAVTDVLSFPLGENGEYDINPETGAAVLGDVVICARRADEQAQAFDHTMQRELGFLTAHSMLHLLGYDHVDDEEGARIMQEKEENVMRLVGLTREEGYNGPWRK